MEYHKLKHIQINDLLLKGSYIYKVIKKEITTEGVEIELTPTTNETKYNVFLNRSSCWAFKPIPKPQLKDKNYKIISFYIFDSNNEKITFNRNDFASEESFKEKRRNLKRKGFILYDTKEPKSATKQANI